VKKYRNWFRRLNVRLALMSAILIFGGMTVFTYLVAEKETRTLSEEIKKQAAALAENIATSTASYLVVKDYTSLESILIRSAEFPGVIDLQVMNKKGKLLGDVYQGDDGEISTRYDQTYVVPTGPVERSVIVGENNMVVWEPVLLGDLIGWVRVSYTLNRIAEIRAETWRYNMLIGFALIVGMIVSLLLYMRKPMMLINRNTEFANQLDERAGEEIEVNERYFEINRMTLALNRTSKNLKAKNDQLNQKIQDQMEFTEELEKRVSERTEELSVVRDQAVQANKSKSQFLANMSHEIRTPLTAIIGFSESLLDSDQNINDRVDSIHRIIRAGKHLLRVINEILDLSKIEANQLEIETIPVSLPGVFRDIYSLVSLLAQEKGLSFTIDCDYPMPETIQTDPVRLKQILINLCNNAIKFTSKGGVTIKVGHDEQNEKLVVKVIDTGIGLTDKQINKLFKPFSQADNSTTRRYGGTGLGLHLSKQFAEKLGGDLTVESLIDVGSSFILTISTGSLKAVNFITEQQDFDKFELTKPTKKNQQKLSGLVLLTEDNLDNQRLASLYLKRLGLVTKIAENGKQALEKVDKLNPDLILMDVHMPVMDGLTATRILRERNYTGPIIALTAGALQQEQQECYDAGCNDVCTKPIEQAVFIATLAKHLSATEDDFSNAPPIVPDLLKEDTDMLDLVVQFVERLPEMIKNIELAFEKNDMSALKSEVHTLKGTSGNFGYMDIFELMKRVEFEIVTKNMDSIRHMLDSLPETLQRIEEGLKPFRDGEADAGGDVDSSNVKPFPGNN